MLAVLDKDIMCKEIFYILRNVALPIVVEKELIRNNYLNNEML